MQTRRGIYVLTRSVRHRVPVWAGAAIDAPPPFVLSFQLFEGEKSFESPVVHLAAGGEFRISCLIDKRGLTDFDNDKSGLTKVDNGR